MIIIVILLTLAAICLMELNKNKVWGAILAVAASAEFLFIWPRMFAQAPALHKCLAWIVYLLCFVIIFYISLGTERRHPAVPEKDPRTTKVVTVEQGRLIGVYTADKEVEIYAGIPYAKPPVGDLRWKEPQDPEPWDDVFKADHFGPMSMQPRNSRIVDSLVQIALYHDYKITPKDDYVEAVSEDSLYLNIWKPVTEEADLPVLVYIHGGSLQTGQTWYADHSGEGLARKGVIVVSMAYRLGVFGFYADKALADESPNGTTGNYGLLDQIKALEWVQKNIAAFGGDPSNVTLAGESAGAVCVSALCTSPLARGLFRRAVCESSTMAAPEPAHSFRTLEDALETGKDLKEHFKVKDLEGLRKVKAKDLVWGTQQNHHITIDGYVLEETPYKSYCKGIHNEEAFLHGFNQLEGQAFVLRDKVTLENYKDKVRQLFKQEKDAVLELFPASSDAEAKKNWIDLFSAYYFTYGHDCLTRLCEKNQIPVYPYYFTKNNKRIGANHAGEMIYLYHMIPADSKLFTAEDRALSDQMADALVAFVKTGDPNGADLPEWPESTLLEWGDEVHTTEDRFAALYRILDRLQKADAIAADTSDAGSTPSDDPA